MTMNKENQKAVRSRWKAPVKPAKPKTSGNGSQDKPNSRKTNAAYISRLLLRT